MFAHQSTDVTRRAWPGLVTRFMSAGGEGERKTIIIGAAGAVGKVRRWRGRSFKGPSHEGS